MTISRARLELRSSSCNRQHLVDIIRGLLGLTENDDPDPFQDIEVLVIDDMEPEGEYWHDKR